jgi:hypothetical protein
MRSTKYLYLLVWFLFAGSQLPGITCGYDGQTYHANKAFLLGAHAPSPAAVGASPTAQKEDAIGEGANGHTRGVTVMLLREGGVLRRPEILF